MNIYIEFDKLIENLTVELVEFQKFSFRAHIQEKSESLKL